AGPTPTAAQAASADAWYQIYFTTPELTAALEHPTGGLPEQLAQDFSAARQSIDVAMYTFDLLPLAEALAEAQARGVRVRLVTDTDSLGAEPILALQAAGIPVVGDERSGLMHHKFVVLDGASVWTGSMNFTANDAYRNDNVMIRINSTRLAQNYTHEFEELFIRQAFGPAGPADTPRTLLTVNGTRLANYFSPDDGVAAHLLDLLSGARRNLYFMAYSFTRVDFAEALLERARAGMDVRGVFETRQIAAGGDAAWNVLIGGGLAGLVRQDGNRYSLHSKVFIVDETAVVLGSYNFTRNAEQNNDENVLIIYNRAIAQTLLAEWQRVWAQGN
ncbi:MAG: DUF1669 domain-containing protein, partial [Anaerolineales bacterium]|nr:DUF1669 domain-containing protein [Anaerolineales bacterium]